MIKANRNTNATVAAEERDVLIAASPAAAAFDRFILRPSSEPLRRARCLQARDGCLPGFHLPVGLGYLIAPALVSADPALHLLNAGLGLAGFRLGDERTGAERCLRREEPLPEEPHVFLLKDLVTRLSRNHTLPVREEAIRHAGKQRVRHAEGPGKHPVGPKPA